MLFAGVVLKFVPVMVTLELIGPEVGAKEVIVGNWAPSMPVIEIPINDVKKIFKKKCQSDSFFMGEEFYSNISKKR